MHICTQSALQKYSAKIMINFAEFQQIYNHHQSQDKHQSLSHIDYNFCLLNQAQVTHQTNASMHQPNIQEIDDHYSSIEHSANILDGVQYKQNDIFSENRSFEAVFAEESQNQFKLKKRQERRLKNETKNIPKNFGKGIISFIQKNNEKVKAVFSQKKLSLSDFMVQMRFQKRQINTISDLRRLWTDPVIGGCMRIISNLFFRRYAMHYIFNSRISNYSSHIKYRKSLWNALKNPWDFNHIKQY